MLNRVSSSLSAAARAAPVMLRDAAGIAGVGLIAYGAWLVFPPAGYITGGTLLLTGALIVSRT
jgi:hypothetical protein